MRVVVDTNVLVSALISPAGKPAAILDAWLEVRVAFWPAVTVDARRLCPGAILAL